MNGGRTETAIPTLSPDAHPPGIFPGRTIPIWEARIYIEATRAIRGLHAEITYPDDPNGPSYRLRTGEAHLELRHPQRSRADLTPYWIRVNKLRMEAEEAALHPRRR